MYRAVTCERCQAPFQTPLCQKGACRHDTHCDCGNQPDDPASALIVGVVDGYEYTQHAVDRWADRTGAGDTPCHLEDAWLAAVPVGLPDRHAESRTGRLYAPATCTLVAREHRIRTVLNVPLEDLATDHLTVCPACGHLWAPGETDQCNWCQPEPTDPAIQVTTRDAPGGQP